MSLKVFFDSRQSVKSNESFSPSAQKPQALVDEWKRLRLPVTFKSFEPVSRQALYEIHDHKYVDGVLDLKRANGFGNMSSDIAQSLPWVAGSFVSAVVQAITTKESCWSLTSGAHHAHYSNGGGFCTFNFLMLGALTAKRLGAKKIILIDFDRHAPDGCRDIQRKIGLPELQIYAFADHIIENTSQTEDWLKSLPPKLLSLCDGADLILFNAGADPHENDLLGGVMTSEQMARRDGLVFETAKLFDVPVVVSLAGGYSRDKSGSIQPVLDLHTQTLMEFLEVHPLSGVKP
jgi:acetoin utilization deacetylase AcuC-like enzyme